MLLECRGAWYEVRSNDVWVGGHETLRMCGVVWAIAIMRGREERKSILLGRDGFREIKMLGFIRRRRMPLTAVVWFERPS